MSTVLPLDCFSTLVDGLDHPECVSWGPDGHVYAGGEGGQIYRISLDGAFREVGSTGGFVLGIALDGDGNIYACDQVHHAVVRMGVDGKVEVYASGVEGQPMVSPNYAAFGADGTLYVTDSNEWKGDNGCIWAVSPGGRTTVLRDDVSAFPNGCALSPDRDWLHVVVSNRPGVVRVRVDGSRSEGSVETVVELDRRVPDGIAFDAMGRMLIACYAPDVILRVERDGRIAELAEDWERVVLASPTNVAFCGPDLRTLVVASLCRWHLSQVQMDVSGHPLEYPRLGRVGPSS